jgi:toll-interacting protein
MEAAARSEQHEEWRRRAFLGPLPATFLRLDVPLTQQQQQEDADQQAALALQQAHAVPQAIDPRTVGRLSITIVQAKLVKNYGMTRMDPYVRLRVGHEVYETQTATNGGKNPHWNKVIQCWLPVGVNQIYVEIYDECSITMDGLIAWEHIKIPPQVIQNGETHEDWYTLSGKQGDHQEGMINMVFSHTNQCRPYMPTAAPVMMVPTASSNVVFGMPRYSQAGNVYTAPPVAAIPPVVIPSTLPQAETELQQIAEMFPNVDKEVIKSVYDANRGKKDVTINSLLQMVE